MTAPPSSKRLSQYFQVEKPSRLASLVVEIERLRELDTTLKSLLPPAARSFVHVAALEGQTLVLHAASSVWAARTRYQSGDILRHFRSLPGSTSIRAVRIRVAPANSLGAPSKSEKHLSSTAASHLRAAARSIEDPQLRATLYRLAENSD